MYVAEATGCQLLFSDFYLQQIIEFATYSRCWWRSGRRRGRRSGLLDRKDAIKGCVRSEQDIRRNVKIDTRYNA